DLRPRARDDDQPRRRRRRSDAALPGHPAAARATRGTAGGGSGARQLRRSDRRPIGAVRRRGWLVGPRGLLNVERFFVPEDVLDPTLEALAAAGEQEVEGMVVWGGT